MTQQTTQQTTDSYDPDTVESACLMEPVDYLVTLVGAVGAIIGIIAANSGCAL